MAETSLEERVRMLEGVWQNHEGVCAERYKNIVEQSKTLTDSVGEVKSMMKQYMDRMLLAIIAIALANVFGADRVWQLLSPVH